MFRPNALNCYGNIHKGADTETETEKKVSQGLVIPVKILILNIYVT